MSSLYCYLFYFSLAPVVLHSGRVLMNGPNCRGHVTCTYIGPARWELVSSFCGVSHFPLHTHSFPCSFSPRRQTCPWWALNGRTANALSRNVGRSTAALSRRCPAVTSGGRPVYYSHPTSSLMSSPPGFRSSCELQQSRHLDLLTFVDLCLLPTNQSASLLFSFFTREILIKYWFACILSNFLLFQFGLFHPPHPHPLNLKTDHSTCEVVEDSLLPVTPSTTVFLNVFAV